MKTIMKPSLVH